jgi:hypothetical protein
MKTAGTSLVAIALALNLFATPAFAYIGPGAGITVLGALWGVMVAIVLAVAAVVLWPLRVLFRRRRRKPARTADVEAAVSTSVNPSDTRYPSRR